jgi:hypothetical protein
MRNEIPYSKKKIQIHQICVFSSSHWDMNKQVKLGSFLTLIRTSMFIFNKHRNDSFINHHNLFNL